jgi:2-polyprenyl-3-methyl-5-hydroxy-6-metoxy-1,4-benzoquinol methylase
MKFSPEVKPYLTGEKFANSLIVRTSDSNSPIASRLEFLTEWAKGKRIVHLGCADHLEIIDEKLARNHWLHKLLTETAVKCIGIDNNQESLDHIRKLGFANVHYADISNDKPLDIITSEKWDALVMGEIIEHIGDPVTFLRSLREKYAHCVDHIILTTPHAFRYKNFTRAARRHTEVVNSDHRFWFTPYTLAKVAVDAGLWPDEFWLVENAKPTRFALFKKVLLRWYPSYRDTIIMSCRLNP